MNNNIYRGENLQKVAGYIYSHKGNKFIVRYSAKQDCWGFQPLGTKKFFKTISGVGSYFEKMGLVNNKEKKQSSYRPNKVVNVESGKTLKEEMVYKPIDESTSVKLIKQKVYQPKKKLSHPYVDILPTRFRDVAKKVVTLTYKQGFADKQTFYGWMKEAGINFFQDRKQIARALIRDKIIVKSGEIYKLSEEIL